MSRYRVADVGAARARPTTTPAAAATSCSAPRASSSTRPACARWRAARRRQPGVARPRAPVSGRTHLWQPLGPRHGGRRSGDRRHAHRRAHQHAGGAPGRRARLRRLGQRRRLVLGRWRRVLALARRAGLDADAAGTVNRPAQRNACGAIAVAWGATEADRRGLRRHRRDHARARARSPAHSLGGIGILRARPAGRRRPSPTRGCARRRNLLGSGVYRIVLQPGGSGVVAATTVGLFERPAGAGVDTRLDARGGRALRHAAGQVRRRAVDARRRHAARAAVGVGAAWRPGRPVGARSRPDRLHTRDRAAAGAAPARRAGGREPGTAGLARPDLCVQRRRRQRRTAPVPRGLRDGRRAHRHAREWRARRAGPAGLLRHRPGGAPGAEGPCRGRRQHLPGRHAERQRAAHPCRHQGRRDRRGRRGCQRHRHADLRPTGRAEDDRRRRACRRARPRLRQGRRAAVGRLRRRRVPLRPPRPAGGLCRDERRARRDRGELRRLPPAVRRPRGGGPAGQRRHQPALRRRVEPRRRRRRRRHRLRPARHHALPAPVLPRQLGFVGRHASRSS